MTLKGVAKFKWKLTYGLKNNTRNLLNFHASIWKPEHFHFDWIHLSKACKYLDEKYDTEKSHDTEEWCKFEDKLAPGSKNDMRNFVNFNGSSGKSGNLYFDVLLLPIAHKVSA